MNVDNWFLLSWKRLFALETLMFVKNVIDLLQKVQSKIPVEKRPFKVPIHYVTKCWYFIVVDCQITSKHKLAFSLTCFYTTSDRWELDLCSTNGFPLSWTYKLLFGICNIMCNYWGWLSFFSGKYDCLDLLQISWKKMSFIWSWKRILPKSYLIVEKKLEKTQFVWTKRGSLYEGQTVLWGHNRYSLNM